MNHEIYRGFAKYYDIVYGSRNIASDVDVLEDIFRTFGKEISSVLDIGCGTGAHAIELGRRGYRVTGVDISPSMIDIARRRALSEGVDVEFAVGDIRYLGLGIKYDAAIALYSVISYLTTDQDVLMAFRSVRNHLVDGGLFIFDFWHLPGQRKIFRPYSVTKIESDIGTVVKLEIATLKDNIVDILYEISLLRGPQVVDVVHEEHRLRLFTIDEINSYLERTSFKPLKYLKMIASRYTWEEPTEETSEILCIAKAI